jgi:hypothetical protein
MFRLLGKRNIGKRGLRNACLSFFQLAGFWLRCRSSRPRDMRMKGFSLRPGSSRFDSSGVRAKTVIQVELLIVEI